MSRIDGAATAVAGVVSRSQEEPRSTSFSRHQSWMREFEKANDGGRTSRGPSDRNLVAIEKAAPADAVPGLTAVSAQSSFDPAHAIFLTRATPDMHALDPVAELPRVPAPAVRHAAPMPQHVDGFPIPLRRLAPLLGAPALAGAQAMVVRLEHPGGGYADYSAQVYRQGDQLALVLRDTRLSHEQGDSILRALIGRGLPAGIRRVSVTLNGHTRALQLQDPGA